MSNQVALALIGGSTAVVMTGLFWSRYRYHRQFVESVKAILADGLHVTRERCSLADASLSGEFRGRPTTISLSYYHGTWTLRLFMACRACLFFSVIKADENENYIAQLPDADLRDAVRALVRSYNLHSVVLDPVADGSVAERLQLTVARSKRRDQPPPRFREIVEKGEELARLAEAR
jgi:hypothetical protein